MKRLFLLKVVVLAMAMLAYTSTASAVLVAGWEQWASGAGVKAATQTDGNTTATTANNGGDNNGFGLNSSGSTDGTWGTLAVPAADATTAGDDAYRLTNGETGTLDFIVTDTGGVDRDLTTFHFDTATWRPNASNDWELFVLAGGAFGNVVDVSVDSGNAPNVNGGTPDWYDFDIPLTGLLDNTLDANGTVTFQLVFTGGVSGATAHHQSLDNVAVSGSIAAVPEASLFGVWALASVGIVAARRKKQTA